jgi:hypothetical protein
MKLWAKIFLFKNDGFWLFWFKSTPFFDKKL